MRRHLVTSAAVLSTALGTFGAIAGTALAAGPTPAAATTPAATTTPAPATTTPAAATTPAPATTTPAAATTPAPATSGASASTPAPAATPAPATTTATAPAKTTTPTRTPTPGPVKPSARLYLPDAFVVHGNAVTVPDRLLHVGGVVRPYVAGQWVDVKAYIGRKLIKSVRLRLKSSRSGRYGSFTEKLESPGTGIVRIKVTHRRTPRMLGFLAVRGLRSLSPTAGFGSSGAFVTLIQQRLAAVHFYIPQTGVYDQQTGLALDAYHRLLGWGTSQSLDGPTVSWLLDGRGSFQVRYPHDGTHVEGNLGKQLLALIYGSKVYAIYPISSGKPSTPTVLGHFHVYMRTPGYLPDGMYYSSFFYSGYAIHGYDPAPDYPASHGCMRLPIVDAISVFDWLNYGDVVDVYQ